MLHFMSFLFFFFPFLCCSSLHQPMKWRKNVFLLAVFVLTSNDKQQFVFVWWSLQTTSLQNELQKQSPRFKLHASVVINFPISSSEEKPVPIYVDMHKMFCRWIHKRLHLLCIPHLFFFRSLSASDSITRRCSPLLNNPVSHVSGSLTPKQHSKHMFKESSKL